MHYLWATVLSFESIDAEWALPVMKWLNGEGQRAEDDLHVKCLDSALPNGADAA